MKKSKVLSSAVDNAGLSGYGLSLSVSLTAATVLLNRLLESRETRPHFICDMRVRKILVRIVFLLDCLMQKSDAWYESSSELATRTPPTV